MIKLNVYYEDVLQNWYYQTVDISYEASKVHNGIYPIGIVDYQGIERSLIFLFFEKTAEKRQK